MDDLNVGNSEIVQGLDSVLPMEQAQVDILQRVDDVMTRSIEAGNPDIAANAMKTLLGVSRISGLALSKFIYTFKFQWDNFKRKDSFEEYLEDKLGRGKTTIKRYQRVWEMLVSVDIPREYAEKLKLHPIKSLVPMANLKSQGFELESNDWLRLSNAPDVATVNKIIREIKKVPPKSGSLQLQLSEDGSIYAWYKEQRYFVGSLNVDDTNEIVQKAISRITGDGKVMEK